MCGCHKCQTCHVASRTSQTVRDACRNRIGAEDVVGPSLPISETAAPCATIMSTGSLTNSPASSGTRSTTSFLFNGEITSFDVPEIGKALTHRSKVGREARLILCGQPADASGFWHALCNKAPRHGRNSNSRSLELSSLHVFPSWRAYRLSSSLSVEFWTHQSGGIR